jgi:hypothetical protein
MTGENCSPAEDISPANGVPHRRRQPERMPISSLVIFVRNDGAEPERPIRISMSALQTFTPPPNGRPDSSTTRSCPDQAGDRIGPPVDDLTAERGAGFALLSGRI